MQKRIQKKNCMFFKWLHYKELQNLYSPLYLALFEKITNFGVALLFLRVYIWSMVILTEKPSVARDIATGLNGFSYMKTKGWYQRGKNDCIVHAAGHLLELFMPEDYDEKYRSWDPSLIPIIPEQFRYKEKDSSKSLLKTIGSALKEFGEEDFVLATDADREGELIGYLILSHLGFKGWNTARRFWVSEALTPDVVKDGFSKLKPLSCFETYRESGLARSKADWLVGMNVTRLLTKSAGTMLHFGRVQTCVLSAVYQRDRNIENFKTEKYWQVHAEVSAEEKKFCMTLLGPDGTDFMTKDDPYLASALHIDKLHVSSIEHETITELPPQLFSLTGLQKHCSNEYNMSPDKTLSAAQSLYEKHKCLSYPRTSSSVLGDDNVELYMEKYKLLSDVFPEKAKGCRIENISLENKRLFDSKRIEGHHALIPLAKIPDDVTEQEHNVYMAVLDRFFLAIMPPYKYKRTKLKASFEKFVFTAIGKTVINSGWKKDTGEKEEEQEQKLPVLSEGTPLAVVKVSLLEKNTKPKKHFTNATLLALMEHPKPEDGQTDGKLTGIGTPATRASIISELIRHQYISQVGQKLLITDLGKFLVETAASVAELRALMSLGTTTEWERQLAEQPSEFLASITSLMQEIRNRLSSSTVTGQWKHQKSAIGKCPLCGKNIVEGLQSFYCSGWTKDGTGCTFTIWKTISGANVTISDVKKLLENKVTTSKTMKSKNGKVFKAKLKLEGNKVTFVFEENRHSRI